MGWGRGRGKRITPFFSLVQPTLSKAGTFGTGYRVYRELIKRDKERQGSLLGVYFQRGVGLIKVSVKRDFTVELFPAFLYFC